MISIGASLRILDKAVGRTSWSNVGDHSLVQSCFSEAVLILVRLGNDAIDVFDAI
jgi:hypothetical protein